MKKSWEDQFENPVAHYDRDGNGYCRIQELWARNSYYPDDYVPHTYGDAKLPTKPYRKTGSWSETERELLQRYMEAGMDQHVIAERLCRTDKSVRQAVIKMTERNAGKGRRAKKAV